MALFTRETAAIASTKANQVRWSRWRAEQAKIETPPEPKPPPAALPTTPDDFTTRKLARIRGQIDAVESLLDGATEPQAVDRFANALTRLYDLERVLAGRPLPGSRRPVPEGRRGRGAADEAAILEVPAFPVAPPVAQVPAVLEPPSAQAPARPLGWEYDDPGAAVVPDPPLPGGVTP